MDASVANKPAVYPKLNLEYLYRSVAVDCG